MAYRDAVPDEIIDLTCEIVEEPAGLFLFLMSEMEDIKVFVNLHEPFGIMMRKYASDRGKKIEHFSFKYRNEQLRPQETPFSLQAVQNETIYVKPVKYECPPKLSLNKNRKENEDNNVREESPIRQEFVRREADTDVPRFTPAIEKARRQMIQDYPKTIKICIAQKGLKDTPVTLKFDFTFGRLKRALLNFHEIPDEPICLKYGKYVIKDEDTPISLILHNEARIYAEYEDEF